MGHKCNSNEHRDNIAPGNVKKHKLHLDLFMTDVQHCAAQFDALYGFRMLCWFYYDECFCFDRRLQRRFLEENVAGSVPTDRESKNFPRGFPEIIRKTGMFTRKWFLLFSIIFNFFIVIKKKCLKIYHDFFLIFLSVWSPDFHFGLFFI